MAKRFSDFLLEKDMIKPEFKDAIALLFQAKPGQVDAAKYAKAVKLIIDAGDIDELKKELMDAVRDKVTAQAQTLGISTEAAPVEEVPAEAPAEEMPAEEPTAEEQAAHEAAETPAEEAAEHAPGGSEEGTEAAEGEVKAESYMVKAANYYCESF